MADREIRVLYLDDEENNLRAFQAGFRRHFKVFPASTAKEAYKILEENDIHVALSDQRMPDISGVDFFERLQERHPDVIRILITAYSNLQTIVDAVNKGNINQYIVKPWNFEILKSIIEAGFTSHQNKVELRRTNEELRKTNEELNRFVYSASHDLRAPLMSILGLVQMAKLDKDPPEQDFYLTKIEDSVKKLDSFIIQIIDYYRNARSEVQVKAINFEKLIAEIHAVLKNADKEVALHFNIKQTAPYVGDEFRIKVILNNLIGNGIKYRGQHNPEVLVNIQSNEKEVSISVEDNGIGIPEESLDNVFEMFFRARTVKPTPGSGVGLYIVKEAVNKLRGEIKVASELKKGSKFFVKLPNLAESYEQSEHLSN